MEEAELRLELKMLRERIETLEKRAAGPLPAKRAVLPVPKPPAAAPGALTPSAHASEDAGAGQLLGGIAAICFVVAAAYLIKLVIDTGWLTPDRQLGLAVLLGGSLIGAGIRLSERDPSYAAILPGTGVVILYMAAYGGCLYWKLYGAWEAVGAASVVSLAAIALFEKFRQDFYLVVAAVGTYLCPVLLPSLGGGTMDFVAFFAIWDVVFTALAIALGNRSFILLSSYLALGIFAACAPASHFNAGKDALVSGLFFQAIQFGIFAAGTARYSVEHKKPLTSQEAWGFFPLLLFFYALQYHWLWRIDKDLAPVLALAFAAGVFGLYAWAKDKLSGPLLASGPMVAAFVAVVVFHAGYLELLPARWSPWFAIFLLICAPLLAAEGVELSGRHWAAGLVVLAVVSIEFLKALAGWDNPATLELSALNLSFGALFVAIYAFSPSLRSQEGHEAWLFALIAADVQALMGLSRLSHLALAGSSMSSMERFMTTGLWAGFALCLLAWAKSRRDQTIAQSSLFVLLLTAGKGLLFDVSGEDQVVRIFCLLILGAALYGAGLVFREVKSWGAPASRA